MMFGGRGAGSPTSSGGPSRLDVPGVVDAALDPGPADPHGARARQPAELGGVAGAEHQAVEPVGAGDERVLHLVGAVDHAVAGPHLVHLLVLPGQTGAAQHVVDLLGRAVGVGRGGQPAGSDPHPVDADADRAGRLAELLPGGVHLALGGAMPLDVVPVHDPHGRHSTRGIRSHNVTPILDPNSIMLAPYHRPKETAVSNTDQLLENAQSYAAGFDKGDLPLPPGRRVAIVACMDARLNPYALLGLSEGDAHIIRNAGGAVTPDVIRSLTISQRLLGTEEIVLIHHTDCGMLTFSDDDSSAAPSRRTRAFARSGRPRPSPTSTPTCASRSRASRPARSSRAPTRCGASSTRSRPGSCARSRDGVWIRPAARAAWSGGGPDQTCRSVEVDDVPVDVVVDRLVLSDLTGRSLGTCRCRR